VMSACFRHCLLGTWSCTQEVAKLVYWCLSMQHLNTSVLQQRAPLLVRVMVCGMDVSNPWVSGKCVTNSLKCFAKLSEQIPYNVAGRTAEWLPQLWHLLLASSKEASIQNAMLSMTTCLLFVHAHGF